MQRAGMMWGVGVALLISAAPVAASAADEEKPSRSDRVLGGVISGLLGGPQQSPDATYSAKERERLATLLQSGEYATSRQGEPIDMMVYGIPLTHASHVYSAKPIPPSQTSYRQSTGQ